MPNDRIPVGERVKIFPRGKKKTWVADFWQDGQHRKMSLRTANKKIAVERAMKLEVNLADGTFQKPLPKVLIQDAVAEYLDHLKVEDRSRKTLVKYRGIFDALVSFLTAQGITRLSQFAAVHFDKFRAFRKADHHPKTLYTEGVVIKQLFRWARKRKLITENPLDDIKLCKPRQEPKGGPSLAQINTILATARGVMQVMLAMLAFTGIRSGELQRLRKEDVDLVGNWIDVVNRPGAETKTRGSRKVPIHPRLHQILKGAPKSPGPWFFTAEPSNKYPKGDHWISTKKLNDRFRVLLKKLQLPIGRDAGFTIHSLRHSFETICVNKGIPQRVIDVWLGHTSDKSMAAVYYRLSDKESQKFMKKVPFGTGKSAANAGRKSKKK